MEKKNENNKAIDGGDVAKWTNKLKEDALPIINTTTRERDKEINLQIAIRR